MMITKKTVVNSINVTRFGAIEVQIGLLLVENGDKELSCNWHRFTLDVSSGAEVVDPQIDLVNSHLISGQIADAEWLPISINERERIRRHFIAEIQQ